MYSLQAKAKVAQWYLYRAIFGVELITAVSLQDLDEIGLIGTYYVTCPKLMKYEFIEGEGKQSWTTIKWDQRQQVEDVE